jgi:hypothetical protein
MVAGLRLAALRFADIAVGASRLISKLYQQPALSTPGKRATDFGPYHLASLILARSKA